jgi:hypothetical protein
MSTAASSLSGGGEALSARPYWGVGLDVALGRDDVRAIVESYAGDPFEALGPRVAAQWGFRWLPSDYVNVDLTFGAQPELDDLGQTRRFEAWGQVGHGGRPGEPMGARGLMRNPLAQKGPRI